MNRRRVSLASHSALQSCRTNRHDVDKLPRWSAIAGAADQQLCLYGIDVRRIRGRNQPSRRSGVVGHFFFPKLGAELRLVAFQSKKSKRPDQAWTSALQTLHLKPPERVSERCSFVAA